MLLQDFDEVFEGACKIPSEETMTQRRLGREDANLEDELCSLAAHLEQAQKSLQVMQTALVSTSQDEDRAQKHREIKERAGHRVQAAGSQSVDISGQQLQCSERPWFQPRRLHSCPINVEFPHEQWSIAGLGEKRTPQIQVNIIIII